MTVGGAAAPPALIEGFEKRHGISVLHAWGMTELNPMGTVAQVKHHLRKASPEEQLGIRASQGYAVPFVETRHVGEDGRVNPRVSLDDDRAGYSAIGCCKLVADVRNRTPVPGLVSWSDVEIEVNRAVASSGDWHLHWPPIKHHHGFMEVERANETRASDRGGHATAAGPFAGALR